MQLQAADSDNDLIQFQLTQAMINDSASGLPVELLPDGQVLIRPRSVDTGTHKFIITAFDGLASVEQQLIVNVVTDFDTTTRVTGRILTTTGEPLADLPVSLSRANTITDGDGNFTLILTDDVVPTEDFSIQVPQGDPQFDPLGLGNRTISMFRSQFDPFTGDSEFNPRQHPNAVSHYLDGGIVYGTDELRANALRTFDGGKLIAWDSPVGQLLPTNSLDFFFGGPLENDNGGGADPTRLFVAGDVRAPENVGLASLHTLLLREHNRLADSIQQADPGLDDETIYQRARRLVTAIIQQITFQEYLPLLVGEDTLEAYVGYDPDIDPETSKLFTAAAFRLGHSQMNDSLWRRDSDGNVSPEGDLSLRAAFFNSAPIIENGIDEILQGMMAQPAQQIDLQITDPLRNFLFGPPGSGGLDLAALNIQRGRDLGLPDYNQARIDFGLAPVTSFDDISSDELVRQRLRGNYASVNDIDVWVGMLAEDHVPGAMVGELTRAVIVSQFKRSRDGDRYWFENEQLTDEELTFVRDTTIGSLISRNTSITPDRAALFTLGTPPQGPGPGGSSAISESKDYRSYDGYNNNPFFSSLGGIGRNLIHDSEVA
ncbi:MAG: hypothetical protein KDA94_17360, partial [Acidimicrobiales bacterium]|nr:hypothetical protein [Acidimicrobiales bacterium]